MAKRIVDARGQSCPKPVVMSRRALAEAAPNDEIQVVVDSETSKSNVIGFFKSQGLAVGVSQQHSLFRVVARKNPDPAAALQQQPSPGTADRTVRPTICVKSSTMGIGDGELGGVLMQAYLNVLGEISPLPETIVFYNSGIMLVLKDSPVLESLQQLERAGVRILVCGTCAGHFRQKDNVAVGIISNMYDIAEALSCATHVVYP